MVPRAIGLVQGKQNGFWWLRIESGVERCTVARAEFLGKVEYARVGAVPTVDVGKCA